MAPSAAPPGAFTDHRAKVVDVQHHPWPYFTVRLRLAEAFGRVSPGQFVMTIARFGLEPYLRRAFSVFTRKEGADAIEIEIFGKVIGPGTAGLARLEAGEEVPVLGPLGRGFQRAPEEGRSALVAGGIGSAGLLLWAAELASRGSTFDFYYGGFGAVDLALWERFAALAQDSGGETVLATENGEEGHRGRITEPLEEKLLEGRYDALYTCGPVGLMARVAELGRQHGVWGQAALETEMGCGYGACLGCAVPHPDGRYLLCCRDGPVFGLDEVAW